MATGRDWRLAIVAESGHLNRRIIWLVTARQLVFSNHSLNAKFDIFARATRNPYSCQP